MAPVAPTACGIEIAGRRAAFVFLTHDGDRVVDLTGRRTQLKIDDPDQPEALRGFCQSAHAIFDDLHPARIAVVARRKSGRFAAGGATFKLEALLQLYGPTDVALVAPADLRRFAKEQRPELAPRFSYQKNAYLLALYLLAGVPAEDAGPAA